MIRWKNKGTEFFKIYLDKTETLLNRSKMKENWMNLDIQKSYLLKDN